MNKNKNTNKYHHTVGSYWIFLLVFGFWMSVSGGDMPLQKAVEKGINMDATLLNRHLDNQKNLIELQKARDTKWFTLDANGSYIFKSEQMEISFIPGKTIEAGSKHNYDLKLGLQQPIFTGNMIANTIRMEEQKTGITALQVTSRELEVAGLIKSSYFSYHLLAAKKNSLTLLVESLKLHLDLVTALFKEEQVKKSDLLETELKITETEINIEELDRQMKEEQIRFFRLCGCDITEIEENYDETTGSFENSLAQFQATHPQLKVFDENIRVLQTGKKILSGSYLPRIQGFAELHYGKPGLDFFKNQWSFYFQGGINISLKVFDWNKLKRDKQLADLSIQQIANQKADVMAEVTQRLKQFYERLQSLEKQMQTTEKLITLATEDTSLKEALYKENQSSNIDYLTALLTRQRYETQQKELHYQYQFVKMNINVLIANSLKTTTNK